MKIRIFLVFLCCHAVFILQAQDLSLAQRKQLDTLVSRDVPPMAPGVACGIVKNGQVIYTYYGGYADLERKISISDSSRFNIASNGKQFTALAIIKLEQEGKLALTDDFRRYLPGFFTRVEDKITLEQLLTHQSGIRDIYDLLSLRNITWWKQSYSNKDIMDMLDAQRMLNFSPGAGYLYSNSNYIILAEIISEVTGQPFAVYLNKLFRDLGMPDTSFEPDYKRISGQVAHPYFNFSSWQGYDWVWNTVGDGNLFTTLPDQLKWEQILQTEADPEIRALIARSQSPVDKELSYGFGVEFSTYLDRQAVFHNGSTGAWKAAFLRFPEEHVAFVTLSNSGKTMVSDQNNGMADIYFNAVSGKPDFPVKPVVPGVDDVKESEITGIYRNASNMIFQFSLRDDGLYLSRTGRNDILLEREEANIFHQKNDPAFKLEFTFNEDQSRKVTAYYPTHPPYSLTRIEQDFSGFNPKVLNGSYYNEETGVRLQIVHENERMYKVTFGENEARGLLLTPDTMLVNSYFLHFDNTGDFPAIYLDGDRIKKVLFVKMTPAGISE